MVGLFHLGLLLSLVVFASCAQLAEIEADPHFWPGSSHRIRRVPASSGLTTPAPVPVYFKKSPSLAHSEWTLLKKDSLAQREYKLVVRDEQDQLMDSPVLPEMILDGDAVLHSVVKLAPATWIVRLEFTKDQAVVKVGFSLGGHRIGNFRQIHFNLHDIDVFATYSYALKTHVRADGKDKLRVYVELRDQKNYTIYSFDDFDMKLHLSAKNVKVEGPFSTSSGPYFSLTSLRPGKVDYHLTIDGERMTGAGHVEFVDVTKRGPAAEVRDCLADMASIGGTKVPQNVSAVEAYTELAKTIMRRYEEKADVTPESLNRTLESFSTVACTANGIWDGARDEAGRALRLLHQRLSR